jgi:hypothetical protein
METYLDVDMDASGHKSTVEAIDHTSNADLMQFEASEASDTDIEDDTPLAKKTKVLKPSMWDAVNEAHKEVADGGRKAKGEKGDNELRCHKGKATSYPHGDGNCDGNDKPDTSSNKVNIHPKLFILSHLLCLEPLLT